MKGLSKKNLKIISATSIAIFSVLALTLGIYAWFAASLASTSKTEEFKVTTVGDCTLTDVKLYKFVYPISEIHDGYDYLKPQDGEVNKYNFNDEEEHFGYYDEHDDWVNVSAMNLFDPIELIISKDKSLKDMNCNVIYEVAFSSASYETAVMDLVAILRNDVIPGNNEILLSDCVDFDVFLPSDLADDNPLFLDSDTGEYTKYYPSYKNNLSAIEKDYYKISYLSSLIAENAHSNFYSTNPKPVQIDLKNQEITMDSNGDFTIYINANYAPKKLEHYAKILYLHDIEALYDFTFEINLGQEDD